MFGQADSPQNQSLSISKGVAPARLPWRHYWPAALLAVVGLMATAFAGWQTHRWAQARDEERFAAEAQLVTGMIQQKMERYESMLGRLSDACARENGEITSADWGGWLSHTLGTGYHYPNLLCVVVAPRITGEQRAAFEQRAAAEVAGHPGRIASSRTEAKEWLPVWRRSADADCNEPALGDDLLAETVHHPSFESALSATVGWVAERPSDIGNQKGNSRLGFWFAVPLRPLEFTNRIAWQRPYESAAQATERRERERAAQANGLLAAFIGGDSFLEEFNSTNRKVRVQLFASKTPSPDMLLNPEHQMPIKPRHSLDLPMRWYGREWISRVTSTASFEAESARHRAWSVWVIGAFLSLGSAAAVAWQIRGRWRETALSAQLREVLTRQERLSRDLHDGTLQSVYGIGLALQRAQRLLEKCRPEAVQQINETTGALQQVIGELRDFIRQTDPGTREEVPLSEALAGVVAHQKLGTEMNLELKVKPESDCELNPSQSLQLLNIAREALSNSIRHSGGRQVRIALGQQDGLVCLEVADDGCGFDPTTAQNGGRGLVNLAARVRELGGTHRWEQTNGDGCRLIVEVPLSPKIGKSPA